MHTGHLLLHNICTYLHCKNCEKRQTSGRSQYVWSAEFGFVYVSSILLKQFILVQPFFFLTAKQIFLNCPQAGYGDIFFSGCFYPATGNWIHASSNLLKSMTCSRFSFFCILYSCEVYDV